MPLKRISEGMIVIGFVSIAAMIVVALISRNDNSATVITAVLGFGASTIGGVLAVIARFDRVERSQDDTHSKLDDIHTIVNSQRELMQSKIEELKAEIVSLKEKK